MTPSSTSSSEPRLWRRFWLTLLGCSVGAALFVYLFVVLVDPFGSLPVSLPFARGPVDSNARYAFPMLARDARFDSAIVGTSTSRLLRPVTFDAAFGTHFVNLSMNAAPAYEQSRILELFLQTHPAPKMLVFGLDSEWCKAPAVAFEKFTDREFPEWLYSGSRWTGYLHMADFYTIEKAGQAFAEWTGLKRRVYGRDGYTRFVPDETVWSHDRMEQHMQDSAPWQPPVRLEGDPGAWDLPGIALMRSILTRLPPSTRTVLMFVPYNKHLLPLTDSVGRTLLVECKRRMTALAVDTHATLLDFMRPSPITMDDDNYWDPHHYRVAVAERVVADIATALQGDASPDVAVLHQERAQQTRDGRGDDDARRVEADEPEKPTSH